MTVSKPWGSPEPIPGRCGAKLPGTNPPRYCQRWPLKGKRRCRRCGGMSPSGPAHYNWKHGMYSKVLPTGLAAHYESARENPALVTLTEQIALVDAKQFELLEKLTQGESPASWARVQDVAQEQRAALVAFNEARRPPPGRPVNVVEVSAALARLDAAIAQLAQLAARGVEDAHAWNAIVTHIYLRKKLVDSEVRRQKMAHDTLTADRALALFAYLTGSITRHVRDPKERQAIVDDMRRLLPAAAGGDER